MDIHQQKIHICSPVYWSVCLVSAQCCRCHEPVWSFVLCASWWFCDPCPITPVSFLNHKTSHKYFFLNFFLLDDDSDPILGLWFEETFSPTKDKVAPPPPPPLPPLETSPRLKSPSKQNPSENGNILAGRKDPELVRTLTNNNQQNNAAKLENVVMIQRGLLFVAYTTVTLYAVTCFSHL